MTSTLAGVTGPGSALIAGLITSLHCAGMCGPLACALMPTKRDGADPSTVAVVYHITRVTGYTLLGALGGALGRAPLQLLDGSVVRWLPWMLVVFFIAMALRLDRRLPQSPWLGRAYASVSARLRGQSRVRAAALLGFATPLLPCGPLYLLFSLALLSGSALHGAETLLAFGLGTIPLLWLAQTNFNWVRVRLGERWLGHLQQGLALTVAVVLVWRLRGTLGFGGAGPMDYVCF
ncbi:MAG TPA: sulfite exporter TauE/SafE family protein [Candidatus Didemnitutus sp.]|nr:sulfite exporter TauE/SafE family protein [Candidatus Didemnitutus sp.]